MSHKIRFRAWDGKQMHTSFLIESSDGSVWSNSVRGIPPHDDLHEQKDWTLMQFTGLHDMHGKEIYEGDFIGFRNTPSVKHLIGFEDGAFGYRDRDGIFGMPANLLGGGTGNPWEILGNLYEHPDLVKA